MTATQSPWCSRHSLRGLRATEREKDVIDVAYKQAQRDFPGEDVSTDLWCDVTQSCDRGTRYTRGPAPCFSTSSVAYSYNQDCVLSGQGQFRALGWHTIPPLELFSNAECRDLSGDSFSVPMSAMATMVCFLNPYAPWWPSPEER
eukprot:3928275-Amphidinium_carterae.3